VVVASTFLDVMWDMIVFFAWVIWLWLLFTVLIDVFRRHDISGFGKAGWIILVIVLPYLGVLIYLLAEHEGMARRSMKQVQQSQAEFDDYVKSVAAKDDPAAQIANAKKLLDSGAITQAEFDSVKQKALAGA
jgi:Phospholipase_D-nuclease N-terminal